MGQIRPEHVGWWVAAGVLAAATMGCVVEDDLDDEAFGEESAEVVTPVGPVGEPPPLPTATDITIDPRRSLVVTEQAIVSRFTFQRVMDQLVAQSGVAGLTSLRLFQQWWDTQNPAPGLGLGPHCNDTVDASGQPTLNGFPYSCRDAAEGLQAFVDPFVNPGTNPHEYVPIGLFNRMDLAPGDGSHCGEYRIVYAKRSGITENRQRNLIIFEAVMPNPHPQQGLKGCKQIIQTWADLTAIASPTERASRLERFYFTGATGQPPVIHVDHLGGGASGVGQIRTNQFMAGTTTLPWSLREFKLQRTCTGTGPQRTCTALRVVPASVKGNPFGPLFSPTSTHPKAAAFQTAFLEQVASLAGATIADIDAEVTDDFNAAQSTASSAGENNYVAQFTTAPSTFRDNLAARLATLGSTLTPDDIVARAQSLSCAGCHRLNNNLAIGNGLISPSAIGFVHIDEREPEVVGGETRFALSPALTEHFLPKRKQVMEDYLNEKLKPTKKPKDPIGGRRVH